RSTEIGTMKKTSTSRTGWWIVGLLLKQFSSEGAPYWNNYRLVRGEDWRTAFRRATEMGENDAQVGNRAFSDQQEFIGITDLLPIYDEFEDGAELLWQELWPDAENGDVLPIGVYTEAELETEYE
ncbi:DUF4288 domain-containing protein, partial [Roseibacillus persicicus]|uniref:DUF4288 domain-containing protein n=1 Tax=Roseibacillus persicicus TaxID=454148 RepID=UPI00280DF637